MMMHLISPDKHWPALLWFDFALLTNIGSKEFEFLTVIIIMNAINLKINTIFCNLEIQT
jgi:hypothetical protein